MSARLRDPIVHLYAMCWNEAHLLPFFFRHYEPWVQRFVIYDNGSTDETRALLAAKPNVELREFPWSDPDSFVASHRALHNSCWRESKGKADWVVVTAIDEHLHHPDIQGYLWRCAARGITCIPALGYQMVTKDFPGPDEWLAMTHSWGVPMAAMSKLRLFNPAAVEPNIGIGGHGALPGGCVVYPRRDELLLLHYKDLGIDYRAGRDVLLRTGLRAGDRARNWGNHYEMRPEHLQSYFNYLWANAVDVRGRGYVPWLDHREPRFWRTEKKRRSLAQRIRRLVRKAWGRPVQPPTKG